MVSPTSLLAVWTSSSLRILALPLHHLTPRGTLLVHTLYVTLQCTVCEVLSTCTCLLLVMRHVCTVTPPPPVGREDDYSLCG
ncbi:hypothetical protein E2C01_078142 [Portunus trituberculatus]|uniref:Uncharacterized protein n=1 Tax=Portunus trituberculatus TaxID=210409 RepID=A0A5B7IHY6_PORTR|nr:hypothetical protein [Portunus trituberculatus]